MQNRKRIEEIYIKRAYNVRKYEEKFKKLLHFADRKNTKLFLKFFSMLTWTFRLQFVIKESHYITLRLKSMKMCINYFKKRISMFSKKIVLKWQRLITRFHLQLILLRRITFTFASTSFKRSWMIKHDFSMRFFL